MRQRATVRAELLEVSERRGISSVDRLMGCLRLIDELYEIERAAELAPEPGSSTPPS